MAKPKPGRAIDKAGASSPSSYSSSSADPPPPFDLAPPETLAFTAGLDRSKVYITHVDAQPAHNKRMVFYVPLTLNLFIAALLVWRAYYAAPFYLSILLNIFGADPTAVNAPLPAGQTRSQFVWKVLGRTAIFALDFGLFRIVAPWPYSFFLENPGNPVSWRRAVGFRDAEVYVRVSRGWGADDLLGGPGRRGGGESPFFKTRVLPHVDRRLLREKTGYLLMGADYDLDFAAMARAHALVDGKGVDGEGKGGAALPMTTFQTSVWAYAPGAGGERWCVWPVWKLDQPGGKDGDGGQEKVDRENMMRVHERLRELGKEALFFRWVELMHYESTRPGGFTRERQEEAAGKAKELFAQEGVNLEEFLIGMGLGPKEDGEDGGSGAP